MSLNSHPPPPPRTQALASKTFRPPPLDHNQLTLPEIYDWHLKNSPDHPLFVYEDDGQTKTIAWSQAVPAIHRAARLTRERLGCDPEQAPDVGAGLPVVAIVAAADTITYFTNSIGIMRAGYACFPISPRNSPAAIAHLISQKSASHIFVGREQGLRDLLKASLELLKAENYGSKEPDVSTLPSFEELYCAAAHGQDGVDLAFQRPRWDIPYLILHSSGSTSYPRPIPFTFRSLAEHSLIPWYGELDLTGQRMACHSIPMYHGLGGLALIWTASFGIVLSVFKPQPLPVIPTPDVVMQCTLASNSDLLFCVPSFIETWARNPSYVSSLAKLKGIIYGGGGLNSGVGNFLASQGVTIYNFYGSTETGTVSVTFPLAVGADWEYFKISSHLKAILAPDADGIAELVVVCTEVHNPSIVNTTRDGVDAYASADLLEPHPTKPGYWKVLGRVDDQIMHNTGEKTNPGPLETILNQDEYIRAAVMFGRGFFHVGVIIEPKSEHTFDPTDSQKLAEFRNKIWSTVEKMNAYAPQHSRLFKEMIVIASPSKPFLYTAKNTAKRQKIIADYQPEINALFEAVDETSQSDISPPQVWDSEGILQLVRTVVDRVLKKRVADQDDIFQHGCDSLQATWIRNSLLFALRQGAGVETRSISNDCVYQHPSIASLALFISSIAKGSFVIKTASTRLEEMTRMVSKYNTNFIKHIPSTDQPANKVVLLTGSTGILGSNILTQLAASPKFSRVYAFNRKASDGSPLKKRQALALKDRGLDPAILELDKIVLVEGDISEPSLGISGSLLRELQSSVTHIIHNAWRVDFNLALTSFEPNLKGLRNLIDFALSSPFPSPPRLLFTSSIGVFQNAQTDEQWAEVPIEPSVAVGAGYGESKWVGEKILERAEHETSLRPVTIRVGQLSGSGNGAWNTAEWLPSMVLSSIHLKCLPSCQGMISWVPLNIAASAILDFCDSTSSVLHLVHPRPVPWSSVFSPLSSALDIPLTPYAEWLKLLEKSATETPISVSESIRSNPALRLLDFFRASSAAAERAGVEAMGFPRLSVTNAVNASPTLVDDKLEKLGDADVRCWLVYWKNVGYIQA